MAKHAGSPVLAEHGCGAGSRFGDPGAVFPSGDRRPSASPRPLGVGGATRHQVVDGGPVGPHDKQAVVHRTHQHSTGAEEWIDTPRPLEVVSGGALGEDIKVSDLAQFKCVTVDMENSQPRFIVRLECEVTNDVLIVIDASL